MGKNKITANELPALETGVWHFENLGKGKGTFTIRKTNEGDIFFYFRHSLPDGKRDTYRFASFDKNNANGGITLAEARKKADELSRIYQEHHNLRDYLVWQQQQESDQINQAIVERKTATLEALLNGYIEFLEVRGKKRSAQDVKGIFRRRVFAPYPHLAGIKASSVTMQGLNQVVAAVVTAGAGREAAKLRSYLSAAFAAAIRAESDPEIPPCLHGFNLTSNPAAGLASLSKFNRARETTLTKGEFKAYWQKLQELSGITGAALRLSILLGGQRIVQLLGLKISDINLEENNIVLFDAKGKRSEPRRHLLPLTEQAKAEIMPYFAINSPYLLSTTNGRVPMNSNTVSNAVTRIAKEMVAEGTRTELFQLRDIRRTIETLLAAKGPYKVDKDVRAQLQSHGLSGVQDRHYDRHLYMDEKLEAMEKISRLLTDEPAKIIPIRSTVAADHLN